MSIGNNKIKQMKKEKFMTELYMLRKERVLVYVSTFKFECHSRSHILISKELYMLINKNNMENMKTQEN
jgi:hypothetical protein